MEIVSTWSPRAPERQQGASGTKEALTINGQTFTDHHLEKEDTEVAFHI
jgi:hypothetical protein